MLHHVSFYQYPSPIWLEVTDNVPLSLFFAIITSCPVLVLVFAFHFMILSQGLDL